ncbi:MAG: ATP-binding protein [Bacteroidota bacterium]
MNEHILQVLKSFPEFESVPDEQVLWLITQSELCTYQPGEVIFRPGDEVDSMYIILDGVIDIQLLQGKNYTRLGQFKTGEITGKVPFSRMQSSSGSLTVMEETSLLKVHSSVFPELSKRYELVSVFVHNLSDRIRSFTSRQQQNEKLMALGKLSAGLAHELNNPASAMVRSATALRENLRHKPDKFKAVMNIQLTFEQVDVVNELVFRKAGKGPTNDMGLMERTNLEDELGDWMDDENIEQAYDFAQTFSEYCFSVDDLEFVKEHVTDSHLPSVLGWIEDVLITEKMVTEMEEAARRVSDLVSSVKTYSHMDQGQDKERVELKKLIKSTVTILNHKVKLKQVEVDYQFPPELPEFFGYISELNQVWMNILDNALDALPDEHGKIEIEAKPNGEFIYLFFRDNGSGIPEDIRSKIFDPFFTTKDIGKGTGLGLDVVRKIIEKHNGSIEVASEPGNTEFTLCFPLN